MKIIIFLISVAFISSCKKYDQEIHLLETENKILKEKIKKYEEEINNYKFEPVIVSKEDSLKLGEEYAALVGMLIYNKEIGQKVIVCDYINGKMIPNNEKMDSTTDKGNIYRKTPKDTGTYYFSGEIELPFFEKKIKRAFVAEYVVDD